MSNKNLLVQDDDEIERFVREPEDGLSLKPYFDTIWSHRQLFWWVLLVSLGLYTTVALATFLTKPVERIGTVAFRLLFDGADRGEYPNGTAFNPVEIVAAPVLTDVYRVNDLQRYGPYDLFKDSLFVTRSNPDLELLAYEYQAKLSDTKLTTVDRARLEEEFRRKREALTDPVYALTLRRRERFTTLPNLLMEKVLNDTLATWAKQAVERKGATRYEIPMLSTSILKEDDINAEDYLISVDILRSKVRRLLEVIEKLAKVPGAEVVRPSTDPVSLAEVRVALEDTLRFSLDPLLGIIRNEGVSKNPRLLGVYSQGQLFQARLGQQQAARRVASLQDSLRDYMAQRGTGSAGSALTGQGGRQPVVGDAPTLIPQLGESFIDRLLDLSRETSEADLKYRQMLTNRVIAESENLVRLEREVMYYEELTKSVAGMGTKATGDPATLALIQGRSKQAFAAIVAAAVHLAAIYRELSAQNLNPSSTLYSISSPFVVRTLPAVAPMTLVLNGLLVMLLVASSLVVGLVVYHWLRKGHLGSRFEPSDTAPTR